MFKICMFKTELILVLGDQRYQRKCWLPHIPGHTVVKSEGRGVRTHTLALPFITVALG